MRLANVKRSIIHVEHFIHVWTGCGSLSNFPIVISDDARALAVLLDGLGFDNYAPMEWWFSFLCDPIELRLEASFNRPAGWRLREALRHTIGKQWRWLPPRRSRHPTTLGGTAGRVRIPSTRLWCASIGQRRDRLPKPATVEMLRRMRQSWGSDEVMGFHNDGLATIDVASVRGIFQARRQETFPRIIDRLMGDASVWSGLGKSEGRFKIHVSGDLNELLDRRGRLEVTWALKRRVKCARVVTRWK